MAARTYRPVPPQSTARLPRAAMSSKQRAGVFLEEGRRVRLAGIDEVEAVMGHAALRWGQACPCRCPCRGRPAWNRRSPPRRRARRATAWASVGLARGRGPHDADDGGQRKAARLGGIVPPAPDARYHVFASSMRTRTDAHRPAPRSRRRRAPARERSGSSGSCPPAWHASRLEAPSTSTSHRARPAPPGSPRRPCVCTRSTSRSKRSWMTSRGVSSSISAAGVPSRLE